MSKILLAGATGKVGQLVTARLVERGTRPTALVRDPAKAEAQLGYGVDYVQGDLSDASSLDGVFQGVEVAYLANGQTDRQVELENTFIDAAAKAGLPRLVKISVASTSADTPMVFGRWQHAIEAHLAASGIPATLIRPNAFMANLYGFADTIKNGQIFSTTGQGKMAWIDPADIADVVVTALLDKTHAGRTYTLTGPQALTFDQVAQAFTRVLGREVTSIPIDNAAFAGALTQAGLPAWTVDAYVEMYAAVRTGFLETVTGDVAAVLGREPRSLEAWIAAHATAFTS